MKASTTQADAQQIKRLRDAAIEDLMQTTDEDLRKEVGEDGKDIDEIADSVKSWMRGVLDTCMSNHGPEGCYRIRCQLGKKCVADTQQSKKGEGK